MPGAPAAVRMLGRGADKKNGWRTRVQQPLYFWGHVKLDKLNRKPVGDFVHRNLVDLDRFE